jgi:hypothetical protein
VIFSSCGGIILNFIFCLGVINGWIKMKSAENYEKNP